MPGLIVSSFGCASKQPWIPADGCQEQAVMVEALVHHAMPGARIMRVYGDLSGKNHVEVLVNINPDDNAEDPRDDDWQYARLNAWENGTMQIDFYKTIPWFKPARWVMKGDQ